MKKYQVRKKQKSNTCKLGDRFSLTIEKGTFRTSEITILLGENGMGKTTLLRHLKNQLDLQVSYKPQKISPTWKGTVATLFQKKIPSMFYHDLFEKEVIRPLQIKELLDREVKQLSGGELQRPLS
jgi:ATP-binding cassette subfamily E protein 1